MDAMAIGSLLSGVGQLAGGGASLFRSGGGQQGPDPSFYQNWRNDDMNFAREQFNAQMGLSRDQMAMQKEFAQSGVRWRVEDAKAAGLHPLAAVGAAGANYSPVASVGVGTPSSAGPSGGGGSGGSVDIGAALSNMGQGLGRAVSATQSKESRVMDFYSMRRQQQELERGDLQNALLASQLARQQVDQVGPGMPTNVGGGPGYVIEPSRITASNSNATTAGPASPFTTAYRDPYGGVTTLPQKDVNIDEISSPGWLSYMYTNKLLPLVDTVMGRRSPAAPPASQLPPGATDWHFAFPGRWIPVYPQIPRSSRGHLSRDQAPGDWRR